MLESVLEVETQSNAVTFGANLLLNDQAIIEGVSVTIDQAGNTEY